MQTLRPAAGLLVLLTLCPMAGAQVRITEVTLSSRTVELTNFGTSTVNLAGWFFCHSFIYPSPGGSIAAGQSRQFVLNSLSQSATDLGLYSDSNFASAASMVDFVQWGSGGNGRESVAVSKGIWTSGTFLTVPASGLSLHAKGLVTTGQRTGNWFTALPHNGFPLPGPVIETAGLANGQWKVDVSSFHLASALRAQVTSDFSADWLPAGGTTEDLGGGKFRLTFPSQGARQFARVQANF